jgi:death-associated protein kinase
VNVITLQFSHHIGSLQLAHNTFSDICLTMYCDILQIINLETTGKDDKEDLIVLQPNWLCNNVIGGLLSHDQVPRSRTNGQVSISDIASATGVQDASQLIQLFEAMNLCTNGSSSRQMLEFPCFIQHQPPANVWNKTAAFQLYGGIRIMTDVQEASAQLVYIFPRIQVQLRHHILGQGRLNNNSDMTLDMWQHGAKVTSEAIECLVTMEMANQVIDIRLRGKDGASGGARALYTLMEKVYDCVMSAVEDQCPSLPTQRHLLSVLDLASHAPHIRSLSPRDILATHLQGARSVVHDNDGSEETLLDLICFGSEEVYNLLVMGTDLHVAYLSPVTRRQVCRLLDMKDSTGRDWCLLAVKLGLSDLLPTTGDEETGDGEMSKTDKVMFLWSRDAAATAGQLVHVLRELQRTDAADAVLNGLPISVVRLVNNLDPVPISTTPADLASPDVMLPLTPLTPSDVTNVNEITNSAKL